jgi:hypothetical protein
MLFINQYNRHKKQKMTFSSKINSNPQLGLMGDYFSGPIQCVIEFLSLPDILNFCSTCKSYAPLSNNSRFWERLLLRDFGPDSIPQDLTSYKTAYKTHFYIVRQILSTDPGQKIILPWDPHSQFQKIKFFHITQAFHQELFNGLVGERFNHYDLDVSDMLKAGDWIMSLPDSAYKGVILAHIAYWNSNDGNEPRAKIIFTETERILSSLSAIDLITKIKALMILVRLELKSLHFSEGKKNLALVEPLALGIYDEKTRNDILYDIADEYISCYQHGEPDTRAKAENIANHVDEDSKDRLLERIDPNYYWIRVARNRNNPSSCFQRLINRFKAISIPSLKQIEQGAVMVTIAAMSVWQLYQGFFSHDQ